jgi:hypothetical protein
LPRRPDPDLHTGQVSSGLLAMTEEVFLVYGLSIYFERIVTKMDLSHYNKPYQRKLVSSYGERGRRWILTFVRMDPKKTPQSM